MLTQDRRFAAHAMRTTSRRDKARLQRRLLELTKACPFDQCNPIECPLYELRVMRRGEALDWLKSLAEDDLRYLASYHYVCFATKVQPPVSNTAS